MNKIILRKLEKTYIFAVGLSVFPLMFLSIKSIVLSGTLEILFWILLEAIADLKPFRVMFKVKMDMTISFAVQLSAVILLGTWQAIFTIIVATLVVEIVSKRSWEKIMFNAGQYGLSLFITGLIFHTLKLSPDGVSIDLISDLPAIILSVTAYYLSNTFFVSAVISLTTGSRFFNVFFNDFIVNASYFYSLSPISVAAALLYSPERPYVILIMIPPLLLADQALRRYFSLHQEAQETLKVLATTLDERDKYTSYHSIHVAEYARKIAKQMDAGYDETIDIEMAGYVHDLGKVGIPDNILNKNGKLTSEEFNLIKSHPATAYRLLKNLRPYRKCAEYVLHHHERIDGNGYPEGVSGIAIPLGARILAVADSYDAMTTDRSYRNALSSKEAVNEMRLYAGSQFDCEVVEAFITVLKNDYDFVEE